MKQKILLISILALFFQGCMFFITPSEPPAFPLSGEKYTIGSTTPDETYMLELINRARKNPPQEGYFLTHTKERFVESAINYFAKKANTNPKTTKQKITRAFNTYAPLPPLAFQKKLNKAAKTSTKLQRKLDVQSHTLKGKGPCKRFTETGYIWGACGENAYVAANSVYHAHAGFNVDWGYGRYGLQNDLGHRGNIHEFHKQKFKEIGVSMLTSSIPSKNRTARGPYIVTVTFGRQLRNHNFYVTGVIYNDLNSNNFYDQGEGVPDIVISMENGLFHTVTNNSGAYSLPFKKSGTYKIQAYGPDFPAQIKTIRLGKLNRKVDFKK